MTTRKSHRSAPAAASAETPAAIVKRETAKAKREHWELTLLRDIRAAHLPEPERQYQFHPTRRYKADFAYVPERLLIEVQGGVWSQGRHVRGKGYEADCQRTCDALAEGWRILPVTSAMIERGEAVAYIERVLQAIWRRKGAA